MSAGAGRILALDGALGGFSAAALSGGVEAFERALAGDALERGLEVMRRVLERAGLQLGDLEALAVGLGPGSFTGLRIALSYAKALAFARGLPLAGVASYDALDDGATGRPRVALASGRTGTACARIITATGDPAIACGSLDEVAAAIAARLQAGPLACYGATEGVAERLGERGFIVQQHPGGLEAPALAIARIAARRLAAGALAETSPHALRPDYGAEPRYATVAARSRPR
ncbi:MAG: tRNA (adenosine(37)-N6)-threonylcarbamoyltransferase complex dimerization subunit type 1 TsaB [Candidatus Baltobacteraceae bacterium]